MEGLGLWGDTISSKLPCKELSVRASELYRWMIGQFLCLAPREMHDGNPVFVIAVPNKDVVVAISMSNDFYWAFGKRMDFWKLKQIFGGEYSLLWLLRPFPTLRQRRKFVCTHRQP